MLPVSFPFARVFVCGLFSMVALVSGCSKKNAIAQASAPSQGGTCTTACQQLASLDADDDKTTSIWCGRVFTSEVKGGGMTRCIETCTSAQPDQSELDCTTAADSCSAIDACGFLLPPA
jgi:hypothetical protein